MFNLFYAGDSSGYPDSTPGKMWNGGAISYYHITILQKKGALMK